MKRTSLSPLLLALIGGFAAALAQPPFGILPGLLGYGLIFAVVDLSRGKARLRSAFLRAWLGGCAYFVVSLWWLAEPFQVDAAHQGWMAPFAVAFTAMFMALFWGSAGALYRALAGRTAARAMLFAAALSLCEWLRGHILTGFPCDLPGASWRAGSAPSQIASIVGVYGLTWITLALACAPFTVREGRGGKLATLFAAITVAGLYGLGAARLARDRPARTSAPWVRVVQADVRQESKYDARVFNDIVARYVRLTSLPSPHPIAAVIWPEGAIPAALEDYLAPGTATRVTIAQAFGPAETLVLGGYRYGSDETGAPTIFNSLAVIRHLGGALAVEGVYDKYRLVPFGEFMPLDSLASRLGIKAMVHVGDGFSAGAPPRPLGVAGLPLMQPLICYEALYSGFTRAGAKASGQRAAWIVNISNDAWFGAGLGPRQHLNLASYRAIEEGLPMVRATPTGISAIIDAFGRIVPGESLGEGAFGVIDARLPPALAPTLFDLWGDGAFWAMLVLSLVGVRSFKRAKVQSARKEKGGTFRPRPL